MEVSKKKLKILITGLKPRHGKMIAGKFADSCVFNIFEQERRHNIPVGQDYYIIMTKFCSHFNQDLIRSTTKLSACHGKMILHRGGMTELENLIRSLLPAPAVIPIPKKPQQWGRKHQTKLA